MQQISSDMERGRVCTLQHQLFPPHPILSPCVLFWGQWKGLEGMMSGTRWCLLYCWPRGSTINSCWSSLWLLLHGHEEFILRKPQHSRHLCICAIEASFQHRSRDGSVGRPCLFYHPSCLKECLSGNSTKWTLMECSVGFSMGGDCRGGDYLDPQIYRFIKT